jgi:hypothetical protein
MPNALFVNGDSSYNIKSGAAMLNDKAIQITKALFGNGSKESDILGKAVVKHFGKGEDGFNVSSCQFAIHYFFESNDKLEQFLNNVSDNLKTGGLFYATFMDGITVEKELEKSKKGIIEGRKTLDEYSIPVFSLSECIRLR